MDEAIAVFGSVPHWMASLLEQPKALVVLAVAAEIQVRL